ncbi:hypothetical protein NPIL_208391 [Nephila pilipes]|uniref:Uncharacterized protein n=1 Tax=Nephila pilipes TaxID=299642 RepID=A0A8X6NK73_NEPPI|nr:hypothetical protein NPIL_208391 [Nephila pilipes]
MEEKTKTRSHPNPFLLRVLVRANIRDQQGKKESKGEREQRKSYYRKEKGRSTTGVACGFLTPFPLAHSLSLSLTRFLYLFFSGVRRKSKERAASINPLVSVPGLASYD